MFWFLGVVVNCNEHRQRAYRRGSSPSWRAQQSSGAYINSNSFSWRKKPGIQCLWKVRYSFINLILIFMFVLKMIAMHLFYNFWNNRVALKLFNMVPLIFLVLKRTHHGVPRPASCWPVAINTHQVSNILGSSWWNTLLNTDGPRLHRPKKYLLR